MSLTMRCPDAKAIELGGVDTGNMKAYEHPTVAGIIKYRGFTETRIACREKKMFPASYFILLEYLCVVLLDSSCHILELTAYLQLTHCPKQVIIGSFPLYLSQVYSNWLLLVNRRSE